MATTYYIRLSGSDSNAGTSAGAAWRTFGKALGAAGIASGDTVYVGAGLYREQVSVAMTSATGTTSIIGDVDGSKTGDAGEVILSGNTGGDFVAAGTQTLLLAGRSFLFFDSITFVSTYFSGGGCVGADTSHSHDITFKRCAFIASFTSAQAIRYTNIASTAANWTIDSCAAFGWAALININTPLNASADYDMNFVVKNSQFVALSTTAAVQFTRTGGAGAFFPGGLYVYNCTFVAGIGVSSPNQTSATFPVVVKNCLLLCQATGLNANATGQLVEDDNLIYAATPRASVTAGTHSQVSPNVALMLDIGQSWINGMQPRPFLSPMRLSPVSEFGNDLTAAPATDILGRPRPGNGVVLGASGTATSGATTTITDSGKTWGVDQWKDWLVKITGGTGSGQVKRVSSNTATALTISGAAPAGGLWATTPDNTSAYQLYRGPRAETGKATAGTATTLTDSGANWGTTQWVGCTLSLTGGTGSGQTTTVTSHTATALTFAALGTAPDNTTTYSLYVAASVDQTQNAAGAYERHDDGRQETTTVDASGSAIRIEGPGDQEFRIPVDAVATVISVKMRYDSNHGTTNKPQAILLASPEIGVTTETKTMTAAADTWETLSFTTQTPSGKGIAVVRIVARPDKAIGKAFADTFAIS